MTSYDTNGTERDVSLVANLATFRYANSSVTVYLCTVVICLYASISMLQCSHSVWEGMCLAQCRASGLKGMSCRN